MRLFDYDKVSRQNDAHVNVSSKSIFNFVGYLVLLQFSVFHHTTRRFHMKTMVSFNPF